MPAHRWIWTVLIATLFSPACLTAQDSTKTDAWLATLSIGFPGLEGEAAFLLFTFGGNLTRIRPGHLSPDFAIGTMPILLTQGIVPIGLRAGGALPMEYRKDAYVIPSGGLSMLTFAGTHGAILGRNVGVALASKSGMRVGMTWHRFGTERLWLLEIGAGRLRE